MFVTQCFPGATCRPVWFQHQTAVHREGNNIPPDGEDEKWTDWQDQRAIQRSEQALLWHPCCSQGNVNSNVPRATKVTFTWPFDVTCSNPFSLMSSRMKNAQNAIVHFVDYLFIFALCNCNFCRRLKCLPQIFDFEYKSTHSQVCHVQKPTLYARMM